MSAKQRKYQLAIRTNTKFVVLIQKNYSLLK